jgi:hypothetical protein
MGHEGKRYHILVVLSASVRLVGGSMGTGLPVPIVATLMGTCLRAFANSLLGDL